MIKNLQKSWALVLDIALKFQAMYLKLSFFKLLNSKFDQQVLSCSCRNFFFFPLGTLVVEKSTPLSTQIHNCMQLGWQIQTCTLSFLLKSQKQQIRMHNYIKMVTKTLSPPQMNVNHFRT